MICFIIHSKYFAVFKDWLPPPPPRLILHKQMVLIKFGRCEQYIIDSKVYFIGKEVNRWYILENEAAWATVN